ncbi:histone H4 transcription factor isoform X1 [Culex pipiens pallens]|uniref:histone H4 transcription factor isoform X1 n=1 Tax=Culex pipiens pallens TaxID=42434 RepID=UPI00195481CD|nr:histone H4 transcription factor isoform X1 [Culex pipiens pallens]
MGRKRKLTSPVKQAASAEKQPREEQPPQEEEEAEPTEVELAIVEEPESDPLATQGRQDVDDSDGGGDDGTGSEWEDKCRQWVVRQEQPESTVPEPLQDHDHDEVAQLTSNALRRPLRDQLKDLTEKQIQNSVLFDCEWERCEFESNDDLEYTKHVEGHAQRYLAEAVESEGLVCYWDLCDFRTSSATELESHVHFHAYHSRIKTYGASLNTCIDIPKCNNESRRRNHIEMYKASFRCEWGNCDERFNKVVPFFQHVNDHVRDQFPVDRKSTKEIIKCEWTHCPQQYCRRSVALEHVRRHSTERTIGCYNCGSVYTSRLKYIEHCRRQVDYQLREIPCPDCDKLFATTQLMKDHRAVHNKRYECPQCPMKWPSQKALACHIRYRHINEKPYKCHLCEHRTVTKADLDEHIITHDDRKTFRCEEYGCDAAYKCQKSLKKHVDMAHYGYGPSVYACHLCKNTYRAGTNLSKHLEKIHHLKRPPGFNRNVYRAGDDGIFRLRIDADMASTSEDPPAKSSASRPRQLRKILPKPSSTDDDDSDDLAEDEEQEDREPDTFTSYEIATVQPLSKAKFAIELRPGEELPTPRLTNPRRKRCKSPETASSSEPHSASSPPPPAPCPTPPLVQLKQEPRCDSPGSSSASAAKNIDDFTVMRRYLKVEKTEKPVLISYEETNAAGSVIRSETVQTSEISRDRLGRSELN